MRRAWLLGVGAGMVMAGAAMGDFSVFVAGADHGAATGPAATEGGGTQPAGPLVDNPAYASWAKHAVGSMVTMKMHLRLRWQGGAFTSQDIEMTTRLLDVTTEKVTLELQTNGQQRGGVAPLKQEIAAKVPKTEVGAGIARALGRLAAGKTKEGKEDLEVLGELMTTTWQETAMTQAGAEGRSKVWMSDDIPGRLVRMEMTMHSDTLDETVTQTLVGIVEGAATQPGEAGATAPGK